MLVRGGVDLGAFRPRFAGPDQELGAAFDQMAASLVEAAFLEEKMR